MLLGLLVLLLLLMLLLLLLPLLAKVVHADALRLVDGIHVQRPPARFTHLQRHGPTPAALLPREHLRTRADMRRRRMRRFRSKFASDWCNRWLLRSFLSRGKKERVSNTMC